VFSRDNLPAYPLFTLQQTYQWRMIMLGRCSLLLTDNIIIFTTNNQLSDYYLFFYCATLLQSAKLRPLVYPSITLGVNG